MNDVGNKIMGVVGALVTLAIVAVLVSYGANTANVIYSFFSGLGGVIGVAVSPVTGSGASANAIASLGAPLQGSSIVGINGFAGYGGYSPGGILAGSGVALSGLGQSAQGIANAINTLSSSGGSSGGYVDTGSFNA